MMWSRGSLMACIHSTMCELHAASLLSLSSDKDGGNILTAAARSGNAMLINWIMDVCQIEPVVNKVSLM